MESLHRPQAENQRKWGGKPEKYPLAAAFLDKQKVFDRLQRRISAAERSLRASLETFARLRKAGQVVGQALSPGNPDPSHPQPVAPTPPATPSKETRISEIGFVPANPPGPSPAPSAGIEPPLEAGSWSSR